MNLIFLTKTHVFNKSISRITSNVSLLKSGMYCPRGLFGWDKINKRILTPSPLERSNCFSKSCTASKEDESTPVRSTWTSFTLHCPVNSVKDEGLPSRTPSSSLHKVQINRSCNLEYPSAKCR